MNQHPLEQLCSRLIRSKEGKFEVILHCLNKLLILQPTNEYCHSLKLEFLECIGSPEEQLACCDQRILYNPHSTNAYESKIRLLEVHGKHEEIIECFDIMINSGLSNPTHLYTRKLELLLRLNKLNEMPEVLDKITKRVETNFFESPERGFDNKAIPAILKCYDELVAVKPDELENYWKIINFCKKIRVNYNALRLCDVGIEANPMERRFYEEKIELLESLGRDEEAKQCREIKEELFIEPIEWEIDW